MLKDNNQYLSDIYEKIDKRLKNNTIKNTRQFNFKTILTTIASFIIVTGTSLTVYAKLGGKIGGKPVLDWFGIDFSNHYSEYIVPSKNQSIETNGAKLNLINTVCDDGFITFEFNLTLNEDAKKQLGNITNVDNLVISFNDRTGISPNNNSIQIDGKNYNIKSSQRYQQISKLSDYEYTIYQMYFLTNDELQGKNNFKITLDNISIVNMSEAKDFKSRIRNYKKDSESIDELLYKSGSNQTVDEILKDYNDDSTYLQIKNDTNISNDFKVMLENAWYSDGNNTLSDTQTGLKTFAKNYKTKNSTISDVLKENNINEDIETILAKYSDDITIDELRKDYFSDYDSISNSLSLENYTIETDKIDKEMSPERKAKRKEIFTLVYLYDNAEGLKEKDIIMDGNFNVDLSKDTILKDTNIISQDSQTVNYKTMNMNVDKVTVTPIQTIISFTSIINDVNSNSLLNTYDKNYIGLIGYNVYDSNGNKLANYQFEQKRTLVLADGKNIELNSSDFDNNLTFDKAKMILRNYVALKTDDNIDSIKIIPYVQETSNNCQQLEPIMIKLKN